MHKSIYKKILVSVQILLIFQVFSLIFLKIPIFAQVNEISKESPTDQFYYELSETAVYIQNNSNNSTNNTNQSNINNSQIDDSQSVQAYTYQNDQNQSGVINLKLEDIPTFASVANGITFLPIILTLIALMLSPNSFILLIASILGKKKKIFGLIIDGTNKQVLPLVKIRAYYADSTKLVYEQVSDFKGRYGFPLSKGLYRIEVKHTGYHEFVQEIEIKEKEEFFAQDIVLAREDKYEKSIIVKIRNLNHIVARNALFISFIGLIFSISALLIRQTYLEILLVSFYTIMIISYYLIKQNIFRSNYWGEIIEGDTGIRLSGAVVRLFSLNSTLVDTQLSNQNGKFGFLIKPGEHLLYVYANGYKLSTKNKNYIAEKNMIKINANDRIDKWLNTKVILEKAENYQDTGYMMSTRFGVI